MPVTHLLLMRAEAVTEARCQLSCDVYACLAGDRLVFLDLPTNRYLCLSAENTPVALHLLSFASAEPRGQCEIRPDSREKASLVTQALLDRGLLTRASATGNARERYCPTIPVDREMARGRPFSRGMPIAYWRAFMAGALSASAKLHLWSLRKTVRNIRQRKERASERMKQDEAELVTLVTAFRQLRPFYPRPYLCLYDSLALLEFLSRWRFFPLWTFGVKSDPFGAHCWVQWGGVILNDSVERVRRYTPIMIV